MAMPMPQPDAYTPQQVTCITAFDLKGNQLWQYGTPGTSHGASSDIPVQVYDMDGDGAAEVFANFSTTEMTVLDGTTGKVQRTIPLPAVGSNDTIIFANLRGKPWPQDIIVKTRYSQAWAITGIDDATSKAGTLLWTHQMLASATGMNVRGTGHYPLVYDWDGDGKDEVMCGYDFLDDDGTLLWSTNVTSIQNSRCTPIVSQPQTSTAIRPTDTKSLSVATSPRCSTGRRARSFGRTRTR